MMGQKHKMKSQIQKYDDNFSRMTVDWLALMTYWQMTCCINPKNLKVINYENLFWTLKQSIL